MTQNQLESIETRLSRLEEVFANIGETVIAQNEAIIALTNNINTLTEQTTQNINVLAQQAAIDRQAWQAEIQRIWQYLMQQGGNGRHN